MDTLTLPRNNFELVQLVLENIIFKEYPVSKNFPKVLKAMAKVDRANFLEGEVKPDKSDELALLLAAHHGMDDIVEYYFQHNHLPPNMRERILSAPSRDLAYVDMPLPLFYDANASQPSVVGLMIDMLELESYHKVLEIGTGSGYPTAIMYNLLKDGQLVSCEIDLISADFARKNLLRHFYLNIPENLKLLNIDGLGHKTGFEPYDRICVCAEITEGNQDYLRAQLSPGGIMVAPYNKSLIKTDSSGRTLLEVPNILFMQAK